MKRTLMALAAAATVAGGALYSPPQAHATPAWVVPAIIGGVVGGAVLGAAAASANQAYLDPRVPAAAYPRAGTVYVQPTSSCYITRERIDGRLRRVEVCP
ncbi:MAG TPA: hypothetical protein VFQ27_13715 [Xanthobacteraceae bacterium]|nr:hypothetical protein [Xanthobacteraceae bacterium]